MKTIKFLALFFLVSSTILLKAQTPFEETTNYFRTDTTARLMWSLYKKVPSNYNVDMGESVPFLYRPIDYTSGLYDLPNKPNLKVKAFLLLVFDKRDSLIEIKLAEYQSISFNKIYKNIGIGDHITFVNKDTVGYTQDQINKMKRGIAPYSLEVINHIFEITKKIKFSRPPLYPDEDFTDRNLSCIYVRINEELFYKEYKKLYEE